MTTAPDERIGSTGERLAAQVAEQRDVALRAVRSVLGVSPDEEDLVQEVLTRLVVRLRQPGDVTPGAWTWRVGRNVAIDYLRVRRATPVDASLLDRGVDAGLDEHVVASELVSAVNDGLARLPDRQRAALIVQAGLDGGRGGHALVAAELGVSPKAAESILARARHALRRELGEWIAVGAVVGWVGRLFRRIAKPRSLVARTALIAALAGGGATAVVVVTPGGPFRSSPSHRDRRPPAHPTGGGASTGLSLPGLPVTVPVTLARLPLPTVSVPSRVSAATSVPHLPVGVTTPPATLPAVP